MSAPRSVYGDRTKAVRAGEELDLDQLQPYLEAKLDAPLGDLRVEQFPGGHSNLTYLLCADDRELVLRRPPFGSKVKRAHDMGREHRVLSKLSRVKAWAPKPLLFCDDHSIIGADFYLMDRLHGVILRRGVPDGMVIDTATATRLCESLIDTMVELHDVDYEAVGLADLGKPEGFVERQVKGWARRYDDAKTDDIAAVPRAANWLAENMPSSPPPTIIHNDYKFDNVMYESERFEKIIGIFDWEMATVGDPLMDLGTTLCYWVEDGDDQGLKNLAFAPTTLPGMFTRRQLAERYADKTGRDVSNILFYLVFGLFKTAVVLQQIYYRFDQGLTQDPRFGGLIHGVRLLASKACEHIERGSI